MFFFLKTLFLFAPLSMELSLFCSPEDCSIPRDCPPPPRWLIGFWKQNRTRMEPRERWQWSSKGFWESQVVREIRYGFGPSFFREEKKKKNVSKKYSCACGENDRLSSSRLSFPQQKCLTGYWFRKVKLLEFEALPRPCSYWAQLCNRNYILGSEYFTKHTTNNPRGKN